MQLCSVYYIPVGSCTCFGCWNPSSGAGTAVITASGIDWLQWVKYGAIDTDVQFKIVDWLYWMLLALTDVIYKILVGG